MPVPSVPPSTPPQPLGKAHGRAWPVGQIREAGGGGLTEVSRPIRPGSWKAGAAGSRPSGATSVLPAVSRGSSLAKVLSAVSGQRAAGRKWGLPAAPRPRRLARRGRLFAPQPSAWLAVAPKRLRAPSLARPPSKAPNLLLHSLPSRTFAPQIVNASGPTTPGPPSADARAQRSAHCSPAAGAARPAGQPPVHSPTQ